jgi:tryptophan synthase beta subunit
MELKHYEDHIEEAQFLIENLMYNLTELVDVYEREEQDPEVTEKHTQCLKGYAIILQMVQQLSMLLEKDNCA